MPVGIKPFNLHPSAGTQILVLALVVGEGMSTEELGNFFKLTWWEDRRRLPDFGGSALDLPPFL